MTNIINFNRKTPIFGLSFDFSLSFCGTRFGTRVMPLKKTRGTRLARGTKISCFIDADGTCHIKSGHWHEVGTVPHATCHIAPIPKDRAVARGMVLDFESHPTLLSIGGLKNG